MDQYGIHYQVVFIEGFDRVGASTRTGDIYILQSGDSSVYLADIEGFRTAVLTGSNVRMEADSQSVRLFSPSPLLHGTHGKVPPIPNVTFSCQTMNSNALVASCFASQSKSQEFPLKVSVTKNETHYKLNTDISGNPLETWTLYGRTTNPTLIVYAGNFNEHRIPKIRNTYRLATGPSPKVRNLDEALGWVNHGKNVQSILGFDYRAGALKQFECRSDGRSLEQQVKLTSKIVKPRGTDGVGTAPKLVAGVFALAVLAWLLNRKRFSR